MSLSEPALNLLSPLGLRMFTRPRLDSNSGHPPSFEVPACKLGDEPQSTKGYKEKRPNSKKADAVTFSFCSFALHSIFITNKYFLVRYYFVNDDRECETMRLASQFSFLHIFILFLFF